MEVERVMRCECVECIKPHELFQGNEVAHIGGHVKSRLAEVDVHAVDDAVDEHLKLSHGRTSCVCGFNPNTPPQGTTLSRFRFSGYVKCASQGNSTGMPMRGQINLTKIPMTTMSRRLAGMPYRKNSPEVNCLLP